jgi:hypothetical protein
MASLPDQQDQQAQAATGQPGAVAPSGGGATGGGKNTSSPSTAAPGNPGTSATNVTSYLAANAPEAQTFANNITGQLNNQYTQTNADIGAAGNTFNQSVNAGYTPANPSVVSAAASNPTAFVQTPGNVASFQAQANDTYTGPAQFETSTPYSNVQNEITATQNNATPYTSFAGTQAQLGGLGDTTLGEQNLDATLLSQTPGASQEIAQAAGQAANLPTYLQQVAGVQDADVTAAQNNAAQANAAANAAIAPVAASENANIANELSAAQQAELAFNNSVNAVQGEASAPNQLLTNAPSYFASVPNFNLSSWLNSLPTSPLAAEAALKTDTQNPTVSNVATPQDYAEEQALSQLMGGNYAPTAPLASASQAGTFTPPGAPVPNTVANDLSNYLAQVYDPAFISQTNALTNPSPGSDSAAAMLEAESKNYLDALLASDPNLLGSVGSQDQFLPGTSLGSSGPTPPSGGGGNAAR